MTETYDADEYETLAPHASPFQYALAGSLAGTLSLVAPLVLRHGPALPLRRCPCLGTRAPPCSACKVGSVVRTRGFVGAVVVRCVPRAASGVWSGVWVVVGPCVYVSCMCRVRYARVSLLRGERT